MISSAQLGIAMSLLWCTGHSCPVEWFDPGEELSMLEWSGDVSDLTGANCSSLNLKKVPPCLPDNVTALLLDDNAVTLDHGHLQKFRDIVLLSLTENSIIALPAGVFNELQLRSLNLSYNQITSLHCDLFSGLKELRELSLAHNKISFLHLKLFNNLTNLRVLDVSHNYVRNLQCSVLLRSCILLEILVASHNSISSYSLPNSAYKLRQIDMSHNKITDIYQLRFRDLEYVDFSYNTINSVLLYIFGSEMKEINFNFNTISIIHVDLNLDSIDYNPVSHLNHAGSLLLSGNRLQVIDTLLIASARHLFDASENNISTIYVHSDTQGLGLSAENINLSDNTFLTIPVDVLTELMNTKIIDFGGNKLDLANLEVLEKMISSPSLTRLNLAGCSVCEFLPANFLVRFYNVSGRIHISCHPVEEGSRRTNYSSEVHYDDLPDIALGSSNGTDLCKIDVEADDSPKSLPCPEQCICAVCGNRQGTCLHCSHSEVTELIPVTGSFTIAYFGYNSIQHVNQEFFTNQQHLLELHLNHNAIETVTSSTFETLGDLQVLSLKNNKLRIITKGVFSSLRSLGFLDISNNFIRTIEFGAFYGLSKLSALNMGHNSISSLPGRLFVNTPMLTGLVLDNNNLTSLTSDLFTGLRRLGLLQLSNNPTKIIPEDIFKGLRSLVELRMTNLSLQTLPIDIFSPLRSLNTLDIGRNKLHSLSTAHFKKTRSLIDLYVDVKPGVNVSDGTALSYKNITLFDIWFQYLWLQHLYLSGHPICRSPGFERVIDYLFISNTIENVNVHCY